MHLKSLDCNLPIEVHPKKRQGRQTLTNLIPQRVKIYNVEDVEGFVNDCIAKLPQLKTLDQQERDEIVSEGIAILFDLARKYKPRMDGYEKDGTFSGYLGQFLHLKILTAWYKLHPEHVQVAVEQEDGTKKRVFTHGEAPWSLDSIRDSRKGRLDSDNADIDLIDFRSDKRAGAVRTVGDFVR